MTIDVDDRRRRRGRAADAGVATAIALGHVAVALAALVTGVVLVVTATRPEAGLAGVWSAPGLALVVVALVLGVAGSRVLRFIARDPRRAAVSSRRLGLAEVFGGAVLLGATGVAVSSYPESAPWRSPTLGPALVLLALGVTAVVHATRQLR